MAQISPADPVFTQSVLMVVQRSILNFASLINFNAGLTVSAGLTTLKAGLAVSSSNAGGNSMVVSAFSTDATDAGTGRAGVFLGAPNAFTVDIIGSSTSAQSYGLYIKAGSTSADQAMRVDTYNTTSVFTIRGDGAVAITGTAATALTVGNAVYTGGLTVAVAVNTSTVAGDTARWTVTAGSSQCALFVANQNETSAMVTGGPTGPQACLRTLGSYPIVFGTSNTYVGQILSTGGWVIPAPSSGTTFTVNQTSGASALAASIGNGLSTCYSVFTGQLCVGTEGGDYPSVGYNWNPQSLGSDKYLVTDYASRVQFKTGGLLVQTAPSGTAAGAITFTTRFSISQAGAITGYGATAAALVDMSPDSGSFTVTLTGCTTSPTATAYWSKQGNQITITLPTLTATSNATTLTLTGLPAVITPTRNQNCAVAFLDDNSAATNGACQFNTTSTINFYKGASTSGTSWTAAGTKGLAAPNTVTYMLN